MSNEQHTARCRHCWELIAMPSPGCIECRRFKPAAEPWRDPCVFGGAMVGSEPIPVSDHADLDAACITGQRYRWRINTGSDWGHWIKSDPRMIGGWTSPRDHYELEPIGQGKDLAERLWKYFHGVDLTIRHPMDVLRAALDIEGVRDPRIPCRLFLDGKPSSIEIFHGGGPGCELQVEMEEKPICGDNLSDASFNEAMRAGKIRVQIVKVP